VGMSLWLTETITEIADLPALDTWLGLTNLAERIWTFFELSIESARLGNSSSGSPGRNASGRQWIASRASLGGEAKGQPGRASHWERPVDLGRKGVEVWCKGSCEGGRVGHEKRDRTPIFDLGRDGEGECAVCFPEDAGSDGGESGSDQGGLRVFGARGTSSVEPSLSRRERLRLLQSRNRVNDGKRGRGRRSLYIHFTDAVHFAGGEPYGMYK